MIKAKQECLCTWPDRKAAVVTVEAVTENGHYAIVSRELPEGERGEEEVPVDWLTPLTPPASALVLKESEQYLCTWPNGRQEQVTLILLSVAGVKAASVTWHQPGGGVASDTVMQEWLTPLSDSPPLPALTEVEQKLFDELAAKIEANPVLETVPAWADMSEPRVVTPNLVLEALALFERARALKPHLYFELAYIRHTEWMCHLHNNTGGPLKGRKLAVGQGMTPDLACVPVVATLKQILYEQ